MKRKAIETVNKFACCEAWDCGLNWEAGFIMYHIAPVF